MPITRLGSTPKGAPIVGKVSIGIPSDEPHKVDDTLVGKKLKAGIPALRIPPDQALKPEQVEAIKKTGVREIKVTYGKFPERLEKLRVVRKAETLGGYLYDEDLYTKLGITDDITELPIMLLSEDIDKVIREQYLNFDRQNSCVFCSSQNGQKALQKVPKPGGGYDDGHVEIECLPSYDDMRVKSGQNKICPYREFQAAQPCKLSANLSFQILAANPEQLPELGRFFITETTSARTATYWREALEAIRSQLGHIAYVPLKLTIQRDRRIRPGKSFADRATTDTLHTIITYDPAYEVKYGASVDAMVDLLEKQAERAAKRRKVFPGAMPMEMLDPTTGNIEAENPLEDVKELEAWADEFLPNSVSNAGVSAETETQGFRMAKQELMTSALALPPNVYDKFLTSVKDLSPSTLSVFATRIDTLLAPIPQDEQKSNFTANSQKNDPNSGVSNAPDELAA